MRTSNSTVDSVSLWAACAADTEAECLAKPFCRWFFYTGTDCTLCKAWFDDQKGVTGCRDWDPAVWCANNIFADAQHKQGGSPAAAAFKEAVTHYRVRQGTDDPDDPLRKESMCSVWCDRTAPSPCFGQLRAVDEVKGVNYGGRFIPEFFMGLPGSHALFADLQKPWWLEHLSLCDVGDAPDAAKRMAAFLDLNIQATHFKTIAQSGMNVVRLPLGYWQLMELPSGQTPNGAMGDRWKKLQSIMPLAQYRKYIDKVFALAADSGLRIMMDLHGAPGAQTDKSFTGCNPGAGKYYMDTDWNRQLFARAIEAMAAICHAKGADCYGIELLNEPNTQIPREHLQQFYTDGIAAARKHLPLEQPIVIMEWANTLSWWRDRKPFWYKAHGRIMFSTHVYSLNAETTEQQAARSAVGPDVGFIKDFHFTAKYPLIVSEYCLAGHGSANPGDPFDYKSLADWYVHQFNQFGRGSMLWNFDANQSMPSWGPVATNLVPPQDWLKSFT